LNRPDIVHIATEGPLGWSALAAATKLKLPVSTGFHTNFHSYSKHYGMGFLRKPIAAYLRNFHNRALATPVPTEGLRDELDCYGFRNLHVVSRGVDTRLLFSPSRRSPELRRAWGAGEHGIVAMMGALLAVHGVAAVRVVLHMVAVGFMCTLLYKCLKAKTSRPRPYQVNQAITCNAGPTRSVSPQAIRCTPLHLPPSLRLTIRNCPGS
jgi:hypothetical protein